MEKINSKLWGSCSSNLTRFQLNRRKFIFFTRGGSKLFTPQPFSHLCIKYGLVFYKNDLVQFCNNYLVGPSQKSSFWALKKWKVIFSCKENDNFLRQHCLEFQDAPLCMIWGHLHKLCHECGHKIDHLAWKPLISTRDSSFLRTLFKNNCHITSFFIFPRNLATYDETMRRFSNF